MYRTIVTSLLGLFLVLPMAASAYQVGNTVSITGNGFLTNIIETPEGATLYRFHLIRPTVANTLVRDAYVLACVAPDKPTCAALGYNFVSVNPDVFPSLSSYGLIDTKIKLTTINTKRYYTTVYGNAVKDIGY